MFDSLSRARLQWMFDNEPEYVKELYDKKRLPELEKNIENRVIPAMQLMNKLQEQGVSYAEAYDQALQSLTPKDGREFTDPGKPVPPSLEDQEKILKVLEDREERRDRMFARQEKKRARKKDP